MWQVRDARHAAVVSHDLADDAGGNESGEAGEIDGSFGLSGADEHAALARAEREDVAGASEISGPRGRIDGNLDGAGAVAGGDAGCDTVAGVNGLAEGGAVVGSILGRHVADAEMVEALLGHGEADEAASELGHEVDGVGRNLFGGHSEVALVLAIFIVDDDNHASRADFGDSGGDVGEGGVGHSWPWSHRDGSVALQRRFDFEAPGFQ